MKKTASFKDDLYNFSVGFFMGGANVIPGVSGGTMLFIMGAFGKLVDAMRDIASLETLKMLCRFDFKGLYNRIQWRFLIGLGLGILVSFATLAKLFVWLLKEHQMMTFAFFFGLIAASIITVNKQMKKWTIPAIISAIISTAAAYAIISLVPTDTGNAWYMMILCGMICVIAMILPGLSGSFLMLIFGQYDRVWSVVGNVAHLKFVPSELLMLSLLSLGAVIGLGAFVHVLNYLMKHFHNCTVAALIGFMIGSVPRIWPFQHAVETVTNSKGEEVVTKIAYELPGWNSQLLYVSLAALGGLVLVLLIEFFASKKQTQEN